MVGYTFMTGHPGKKLLFMGQDFGQHQEWSEARELDWFLLEKDRNRQLQNFVRALLHIYRKNKCLYEYDCYPEGFEWINANDGDRSISPSRDIRPMARTTCSLSATSRRWQDRITGWEPPAAENTR